MCRISQELVDLIIDLIAGLDNTDWRLDALHACTLVSSAWLQRARTHIFHRIYLRMDSEPALEAYLEDPEADFRIFWLSPAPPNYVAFLSLFRRSPRKPSVKELVVTGLTVKTRVPFVEAMSCMAKVHSITFGGGSPSDSPPFLGGAWYYPHLKRVRFLRLQAISIPSLCTLSLLLNSMPMLDSLTVVWPVTIENPVSSSSRKNLTLVTTSVRLLDISSCPPPWDHLLLNLFSLIKLKVLLISPTLVPDDALAVQFAPLDVLEIDHTHRHVLKLPPSFRMALPFYVVPTVVLRLTCDAQLNVYIQALEDAVRAGLRVDLPVMRKLHVHVFSEDESGHHVWERLDSVLGDMVELGFDRLVIFCPTNAGEVVKKAMTRLGKMLILDVIAQMPI
ncbi:hypothetical protein CPB85DRAFT_1441155 [Mucidula mucida]|nr:hypothetical protein CPB85DRAFT_1441155 [Mucidula mucida]